MGKRDAIPCPASCGRYQQPGRFLCTPCWRKLPDDMQRAVWRTWHAVERINPKAFPSDFLHALSTYRLVRKSSLLFLANLPPERDE